MQSAAGESRASLAVDSADGAATPLPQRPLRSMLTAEELAEEDHELAMMEQYESVREQEAALESDYATGLIAPVRLLCSFYIHIAYMFAHVLGVMRIGTSI